MMERRKVVLYIATSLDVFIATEERLVGGGELNNTLIQENMIDEMIVSITPALLGKGIPLFKGNNNQTRLQLTDITRYNQFVELRYDVNMKSAESN